MLNGPLSICDFPKFKMVLFRLDEADVEVHLSSIAEAMEHPTQAMASYKAASGAAPWGVFEDEEEQPLLLVDPGSRQAYAYVLMSNVHNEPNIEPPNFPRKCCSFIDYLPLPKGLVLTNAKKNKALPLHTMTAVQLLQKFFQTIPNFSFFLNPKHNVSAKLSNLKQAEERNKKLLLDTRVRVALIGGLEEDIDAARLVALDQLAAALSLLPRSCKLQLKNMLTSNGLFLRSHEVLLDVDDEEDKVASDSPASPPQPDDEEMVEARNGGQETGSPFSLSLPPASEAKESPRKRAREDEDLSLADVVDKLTVVLESNQEEMHERLDRLEETIPLAAADLVRGLCRSCNNPLPAGRKRTLCGAQACADLAQAENDLKCRGRAEAKIRKAASDAARYAARKAARTQTV